MNSTNTPNDYVDGAWYIGCWSDEDDGVTRYGDLAEYNSSSNTFLAEMDENGESREYAVSDYDFWVLQNVDRDQDEPEDNFRDDVEADADVLRSAGMGTDEDYGYFGGDEGY